LSESDGNLKTSTPTVPQTPGNEDEFVDRVAAHNGLLEIASESRILVNEAKK